MRVTLLTLHLILCAVSAGASPLYHSTTPCDVPLSHTPDKGVAYEPGITASGEPIAPADLNASPAQGEPEINVQLDVPLSEHIARGSRATELTESLVNVGSITVQGQDSEADILGEHYESGRDNQAVAGCD